MTWWEGATNAVDRCIIEWDLRDWWDIDDRLRGTVPPWLIRERLALFHAQKVAA